MKFLIKLTIFILFLIMLYMGANYWLLINLIESPLPESEEKVPDIELLPE